jgi:uncharacterized membrane protein
MTPPAVLSWAAVSGRVSLTRRPFNLLDRPWVMNLLWFSALGEIVADKLPFIPSRTDPGPFLARVASGAGVAAAQFSADNRSPMVGAVLGAGVAAVQTFAGYSVRMRLNQSLPNPIAGSIGDATALANALLAVVSRTRRRIW